MKDFGASFLSSMLVWENILPLLVIADLLILPERGGNLELSDSSKNWKHDTLLFHWENSSLVMQVVFGGNHWLESIMSFSSEIGLNEFPWSLGFFALYVPQREYIRYISLLKHIVSFRDFVVTRGC